MGRRPSRSISTDSEPTKVKIEMEDDPELGRGSRKKKKRKFFGDENVDMNGGKICKSFEYEIRKDIFSPEDISPPSDNAVMPDVITEQNSAFFETFDNIIESSHC